VAGAPDTGGGKMASYIAFKERMREEWNGDWEVVKPGVIALKDTGISVSHRQRETWVEWVVWCGGKEVSRRDTLDEAKRAGREYLKERVQVGLS
jgi:hypothetical protein